MNYSEMSDFEINKAVALASGRAKNTDLDWQVRSEGYDFVFLSSSPEDTFDPCNSWSDAGPLMLLNNIGIEAETEGCCSECADLFHTGEWEATSRGAGYGDYFYFSHSNPLRAAMIVFLMMQEGK